MELMDRLEQEILGAVGSLHLAQFAFPSLQLHINGGAGHADADQRPVKLERLGRGDDYQRSQLLQQFQKLGGFGAVAVVRFRAVQIVSARQ